MRVLIVEDEKALADFLRKGLKEHGHAVDVAYDGEEGEHFARSGIYDAIILDVKLPVQSGFELVRNLRAEKIEVPVLFLSALDGVEDRITGLDLGGDDFLTKPFAFKEVLARLRALERRSGKPAITELKCADLTMHPSSRKVTRGGEQIDLTPREFNLLHLLMKQVGEVVTRTSIVETIWDMNFDSFSNVVDVLMHRLRSKVDEPFNDNLIHTVRGVGYVIRPPEN
jgi:two-component system copper resistance phosphate regulon response regulator CusR